MTKILTGTGYSAFLLILILAVPKAGFCQYDVYYPVGPIQQMKNNDCWIVSYAMLERWKKKNPIYAVGDALNDLGEPFKTYYDTDSGLPDTDKDNFFAKANVGYDPGQSYTIDGWISLLKNKGPLIVDIFSFVDPVTKIVWTHARLLVGIKKSADNQNQSQFTFLDPAQGKEITQAFGDFIAYYEALPRVGVFNAQVAYSK